MNLSVVKKAQLRALSPDKRLGKWLKESIDEKLQREQKKIKQRRPVVSRLSE